MRCDPRVHPRLAGRLRHAWVPTELTDAVIDRHDDWSCAGDIEAAGFVANVGTGIHRRYTLTPAGDAIVAVLRAYRDGGGGMSSFRLAPDVPPGPDRGGTLPG